MARQTTRKVSQARKTAKTRSSAKSPRQTGRAVAKATSSTRGDAKSAAAGKRSAKAPARSASAPRPPTQPVAKAAAAQPKTPERPQPAPPAPKKPGYYEALAMYESGVRALQRHDYPGAATQFRTIIERYPEERELQERSQLYLRVCERETARRPAAPQTPQERVYAATVALNAGDTAAALDHLQRALTDSPDSDHAHYIMAVALASRGDAPTALDHLRRAVTLNSENFALARQDPDLEAVRDADGFRELLESDPATARSKARKRR
jgi:tetratricopeptide (TPR) repeat protein